KACGCARKFATKVTCDQYLAPFAIPQRNSFLTSALPLSAPCGAEDLPPTVGPCRDSSGPRGLGRPAEPTSPGVSPALLPLGALWGRRVALDQRVGVKRASARTRAFVFGDAREYFFASERRAFLREVHRLRPDFLEQLWRDVWPLCLEANAL